MIWLTTDPEKTALPFSISSEHQDFAYLASLQEGFPVDVTYSRESCGGYAFADHCRFSRPKWMPIPFSTRLWQHLKAALTPPRMVQAVHA